MATRRKALSSPTPAELSRFDPDEWTAPGETGWQPGFRRWKQARRAWIDEHPDSDLGDYIDVARVNLLTLNELERWSPSAPQPGIDISPPRTLRDL